MVNLHVTITTMQVSGELPKYEARIGVRWIQDGRFVWCLKCHI